MIEAKTDLPDGFGLDEIVAIAAFATLDLITQNNDSFTKDGRSSFKKVRNNTVADAHGLLVPFHAWLFDNSRAAEEYATNKKDLARNGTSSSLSRKRVIAYGDIATFFVTRKRAIIQKFVAQLPSISNWRSAFEKVVNNDEEFVVADIEAVVRMLSLFRGKTENVSLKRFLTQVLSEPIFVEGGPSVSVEPEADDDDETNSPLNSPPTIPTPEPITTDGPSGKPAAKVAVSKDAADIAQRYGVSPKQAEVILNYDAQQVLPAAAGSGKTRTVVRKIKHLIDELDVPASEVKVMAFNKHAATEIQERLSSLIGKDRARDVKPQTTHAFVLQHIKGWSGDHAKACQYLVANKARMGKTDVYLPSQSQIVVAAFNSAKGRYGKEFVSQIGINARHMLAYIGKQKAQGVSLTEFLEAEAQQHEDDPRFRFLACAAMLYEELKGITTLEEKNYKDRFSDLYDKYVPDHPDEDARVNWDQTRDRVSGDGKFPVRYDFDDLLYRFYEGISEQPYDSETMTLRKKGRLAELRAKYTRWFVDEAQDLSPVQVRTFELLAGGRGGDLKDGSYTLIGDDAQCVEGSTELIVRRNRKQVRVPARKIQAGDRVLCWHAGRKRFKPVRHAWPTSHDFGYAVRTTSGKMLHMSPNHRVYAGLPQGAGRWYVYLMYRVDMGFRVGVSQMQPSQNVPFARASQEQADAAWLLDSFDDQESALAQETKYSLQYGIPTLVFYSRMKGRDQNRINQIFAEFGKNGEKLLRDKGASLEYPCWISQGTTRGKSRKKRVNLLAHAHPGTGKRPAHNKNEVTFDSEGVRIRKYVADYDAAQALAQQIAVEQEACVVEKIAYEGVRLALTTACCVQVGATLLTRNGLEQVESVSIETGVFFDIDVADARNFFGNGILSHNSIYGFRGANPEDFVQAANAATTTRLDIDTNFRSRSEIVNAADQMINQNTVQLQKNTIAARGSGGSLVAHTAENYETVSNHVAASIATMLTADESYVNEVGQQRFAIITRTNRELNEFEDELAIRDIPYVIRGGISFWRKSDVAFVVGMMALAAHVRGDLKLSREQQLQYMGDVMQYPRSPGAPSRGGSFYAKPMKNSDDPIRAIDSELKTVDDLVGIRRDPDAAFTAIKAMYDDVVRVSKAQSVAESFAAIMQSSRRGFDGETLMDALSTDSVAGGDDETVETAADETGSEANGFIVFDKLARFIDYNNIGDDVDTLLSRVRESQDRAAEADRRVRDNEIPVEAVILSTVHKTKGLEYENVWTVMNDGTFPSPVFPNDDLLANQNRVDAYAGSLTQLKLEEERRLAYVAVTRAVENCTIFTTGVNHKGLPATPSPFIGDLGITPETLPKQEPEPEDTSESVLHQWRSLLDDANRPESLPEPTADATTDIPV